MLRKKLKLLSLFGMLIFLTGILSGCNKSSKQINSINELAEGQYVIGVPSLTYCAEKCPNEFPNAEIRAFDDIPGAYLALQQGKIDAFVQDKVMARVDLSKGIDDVKILDGEICGNNNIVVGISSESKIVNKEMIDLALTELSNNGTINEMYDRWVNRAFYDMPEIKLTDENVPTLKVATSGTVEPYSFYKNGVVTGFDIELAKRIAQKLNFKLTFDLNSSYTSLISSMQTGMDDLLMANLYETQERKQQMSLSIPYSNTSATVIVKDYSKAASYSTLEDLKHKKIGYESTSTHFDAQIDKFLPEAKKVLYNNTADCLIALKNNRIDAFVNDLPAAKYIESVTDGVKILPEYLDKDDYAFLFKKNSPYTAEFNEVIEDFRNRNILKELEDKWFNDFEHPNKEVTKQDTTTSYKKTLIVSTTALLEPMSYYDNYNNVIGFEIDLLNMIGNVLNYKIKVGDVVNNFGSLSALIETGKSDIGFNTISVTEERLQKFDFTVPYYQGAAVLMVRNNASTNSNFFEKIGNSFKKTFVVEERWKMILEGIGVTLIISIFSGILGIAVGFGLCMLRRGKNKPLNAVTKGIIKLIQGTPIVVFLMIMYYVVFGKIDIPAIIVSILAFGINFGVYASEIMRSGFETVDKGQIEAARAMGYSKMQTFWKISFPQATKKFIPVLRQEFISMVKMTSIAGYISVAELTRVGDIIRSKTMEAFFPLIVIALIYFGLSELLTLSLTLLEKKLDSKSKPFKVKGVKKHGK